MVLSKDKMAWQATEQNPYTSHGFGKGVLPAAAGKMRTLGVPAGKKGSIPQLRSSILQSVGLKPANYISGCSSVW